MPNLDRLELAEMLEEQLGPIIAKQMGLLLGPLLANELESLKSDLMSKMAEATLSTNTRMDSLQAEIAASKEATSASIDGMKAQINSFQIEFERRLERQGRQLTSLENFPMFPQDVRPSSAYRVTTTQSCSQPKRVRVGYTG